MAKTAGLGAGSFSQYMNPNILHQQLMGSVNISAREADSQCIQHSGFKRYIVPGCQNSAVLTHFVHCPSLFLMNNCNEEAPTETNMMQGSLLNDWSVNQASLDKRLFYTQWIKLSP